MAKAMTMAEEDRKPAQQTQAVAAWKQRPLELVQFLKDVRSEMHKVVVPSRKEVETTTAVVIGTVFLFAAYFYLVDSVIGRLVQELLHRLSN